MIPKKKKKENNNGVHTIGKQNDKKENMK